MAANRIRSMFPAAPRKGETFELRNGLNSQFAHERKDAIRNTIASMTLGKDVSALFPDIIKNMATSDLDQKKLVYLYLMNYAKTHPDLCILAVNTFVQDSEDPNPLIRALAIRTMGCIRVDKIVDYMEEPLRKTLKDESPYVRKTAAICVAKLFDLNPSMCIENGFLETLQDMIGDSNPMVVANSVQALSEISETAPETEALLVTPSTLKKMLMALNECTEWGRVTILTTLANYKAEDIKEEEHICERVVPQFQHVNPSVVLAAVKVVFMHMKNLNPELARGYTRKMAPPLVTLVSSQPEVQYVALRNINLLLQKQPDILTKEMRVFFCKYNDPPYVKLEKLDIMIRIANEKNIEQLLMELKEYALEVDMDFVKRAVKAIGQCAIKIDAAAQRCVTVLLDLINTRVNYVVQEAIVVIKDIFRKYPGYEGIIPTLCKNIDEVDEPSARASLIWIVGEYAEKISDANDILGNFVDGFKDEYSQVQLQLLTAVVKMYLKKPETQDILSQTLKIATEECDNPDIRDRAYVYWRLLSKDPAIAKSIVLSDKPPITSTIQNLPTGLLDQLLTEISTLASVYHKPPETFIGQGRFGADAVQKRAIEELARDARENPIQADAKANVNIENLLDIDFDGGAPVAATPPLAGNGVGNGLEDMLGGGGGTVSPPPGVSSSGLGGMEDLMGLSAGAGAGGAFGGMANGFEGLSLASPASPPPQQKKPTTNEDILGLF
ncbi:adaptin N terminal region-domain-containing protein [Geopyxis carbonaria]|nr:adaptin N terminal region-domain-containing protein [Geopyxis carbonaria]